MSEDRRRVKALVWQGGGPFWSASGVNGVYAIAEYAGMKRPFKMEPPRHSLTEYFASFDKAKAAAQADYETCILSALVPDPPAGDVEEIARRIAGRCAECRAASQARAVFLMHALREHRARQALSSIQRGETK